MKLFDHIKNYIGLTKIRLLPMILISTTIGYYLAAKGFKNLEVFFVTLFAVSLSASGGSALNSYLEVNEDALMSRTKNRPLPSQRLTLRQALQFGLVTIVLGVTILAIWVNLLTAFLMLFAVFLYVLVYTPLKKITWWNTFVGAFPGAMPILIGWTAALNSIDFGGVILFLIVFFWQFPHFYPIAFIYKEEYEKAGFKMLTIVDKQGSRAFRQIIGYAFLLLIVSLVPTWMGITGQVYFFGASILGVGFLTMGFFLFLNRTKQDAKLMMRFSLIYLPAILILIIFEGGL